MMDKEQGRKGAGGGEEEMSASHRNAPERSRSLHRSLNHTTRV